MPIVPLRATYKQNQYKLGNASASSTETIAVPGDVEPGDTAVITIGWVGSPTVTSVTGVGGAWVAGPVATNGTGKVQMWYAVQATGGSPATAGARTVTIKWSGSVQNTGLYMQVFGNIAGRRVKTFASSASLASTGGVWKQQISGVNTYGHRMTWVGAAVAGGPMSNALGAQPGTIAAASEDTAWSGVRENFAPLSLASSQKLVGCFLTKHWPPAGAPVEGAYTDPKTHLFAWSMNPSAAIAGAAVAIAFDNKESDIFDYGFGNYRETNHESINGVYAQTHSYNDNGVPTRSGVLTGTAGTVSDNGFYPMAITSNEYPALGSSDQADGRVIIVGMEHPIVDTQTLNMNAGVLDAYGQCLNYMAVRTEDPRYSGNVAYNNTRGWYPKGPAGFGAARHVNGRIWNSPSFQNISAFNYTDTAGKSYTVVLQVGPNGRDSLNPATTYNSSPAGYQILSDCSWTSWENTTTIGTGLSISAVISSLGGLCSGVAGVSTGVGKIDAFAVGTDNNIWRRRYRNNAWGNWSALGGAQRGIPASRKAEIQAVCTNNALGRVVLFVNGAQGTWTNWFDENGAMGSWTQLGIYYNTNLRACSDRQGGWWLFSNDEQLTGSVRYDGSKDGYLLKRTDSSGWAYADTSGQGTGRIQGYPMGASCSQPGKVDLIVAPYDIKSQGYKQYAYYPKAYLDGVGPKLNPTGVRSTATVQLFGTDGAFKDAATLPNMWKGITPTTDFALSGLQPKSQSMSLNTENNLSVHSGHSFYMSHVLGDGKVMVLSEHQSNNPLQPTSDHASAYIFDPATDSWQTITLSTTTGYKSVVDPNNNRVGGTDFSDLIRLSNISTNGAQEMLAMVSSGYANWDIGVYGLYPMMAFFRKRTDGDWEISKTYTAAQIAATNPSAATDIYTTRTGVNGNYVDTHFQSEVSQFPNSKHVVFGHYLPVEGSKSGAISIVDPVTGILKATYKIPNMRSTIDTNASVVGQENVNPSNFQPGDLWVAPREFECDPSSPVDHERFTVLLDTYPYPPNPHAIMEFEYNASAGTITPTTSPFIVKHDARKDDGARPEIGTHRYDNDGNMYITCNYEYSLMPGAPMAVFKKTIGERSYRLGLDRQNTLVSGWENTKYGTQVVADFLVSSPGNYSQCAFSHDVDTLNRRVYTIGLNGVMTTTRWDAGFPIGGNLVNLLFPIGVNAVQSVFGSAITETTQFAGRSCYKLTATQNNNMGVAFSVANLEVGRHYKATCDFICAPGHTPKKVEVRVDCYGFNNQHIGASQIVGTITQVDNTSGWVTVETDFDVQDGAARVELQPFIYTVTAGQIHYFTTLTLRSLPFKRINVVDLGINEMRKAYSLLQIRKAGIDYLNQVLYMPAGQLALPGVTGQNYSAANFPQILAQWLTKINLRTLSTADTTVSVTGWGTMT